MIAPLRLAVALALGMLVAPAAFAAPVPSTKVNYELPTATFHAVSGQKMLLDVMGYCATVFDKKTNEELVEKAKQMQSMKMFDGIDLARPIGAYLYLREKPEESAAVLVVPISGEKEARDLLGRLGFEIVKEEKGLLTLGEMKVNRWSPFAFLNGVSPVVRFHDKHAYFALHNGSSDVLNSPDKLVPIKALLNENETAQIAGTLFLDRFPKELQKPLFALLNEGQQGVAMLQQKAPADMPKGFPACAAQVLTWCQRNLETAFSEADTLKVRFALDPKAGDHSLEAILVPKAKTGLAADLLGVKKANGRFAQLLNNESVCGISLTLPGAIPQEIRATAGVFLSDWINLEFSRGFDKIAVHTTLADTVNKQVAAGKADIAGAVYGPDKDGLYTALAAVSLDDAKAVEKAMKADLKNAPKEVADAIKWDAVKIGDATAHTVDVIDALPEELKKTFGGKSLVHVVFTKNAAYVAAGPEAVSRIEKAMALKAADAVGFNMAIHRVKFQPFAEKMGGHNMNLSLSEKDGLLPVYRMDIHGGDGLHVKMHLGFFLFMVGAAKGG